VGNATQAIAERASGHKQSATKVRSYAACLPGPEP
jgi:hypothetical protein